MTLETVALLGGAELVSKGRGRLPHYRNLSVLFEMMRIDPGQSEIPENLENQNTSPGNRYPSFSVASNKQEPENQIRQMVEARVIRSSKEKDGRQRKGDFFGLPGYLSSLIGKFQIQRETILEK